MTIRRIRPEEYAEADNIKRVAFLRTVREEQKNDADVPEEIYRSIWAYFNENNKMTARVRDIEYTMFLDVYKRQILQPSRRQMPKRSR